jgi:trk system potassium uptake protein TrkH
MNLYDAVCHAMSTVATGGFSTHSESIGYFHSPYVEYVASVFMVISSINFSLFYYVSIRRGRVMLKNEELHAFLWIVFFMTGIFMLLFRFAPMGAEALSEAPKGLEQTFRTSLFHVATVISTSGYAAETYDYVSWGAPFWMPTVFIMALGACAGSTAGGIKVIRLLVCLKATFNEFLLQLHPRAVVAVRISGQVLPPERVRRTLAFIFIYLVLMVLGIFVLTCLGLDTDTAVGASISALSNVGPGTGLVGPAGTFAGVPAVGKWVLSLFMLVGRLEIFTVLFLFFPSFWREHK